jgi:hypothetical protein
VVGRSLRSDAFAAQPPVGAHQLVQLGIGEGQMIEPRGARHRLGGARPVDDHQAMVAFVVSQECDRGVLEDDVRLKHGRIPSHHLAKPRGSKPGMFETDWSDSAPFARSRHNFHGNALSKSSPPTQYNRRLSRR